METKLRPVAAVFASFERSVSPHGQEMLNRGPPWCAGFAANKLFRLVGLDTDATRLAGAKARSGGRRVLTGSLSIRSVHKRLPKMVLGGSEEYCFAFESPIPFGLSRSPSRHP